MAHLKKKILGKSDILNKQKEKRKKHVWLSGRLHIEGQLNEGPRLQRKHKDENEAKQNKCNSRERRHDICKSNAKHPEDTSSRYMWLVNKGERTSTSPLALGYPLLGPSRHVRAYTTACRSPALVFSATIHFAMKCSALCSAVLCKSETIEDHVLYHATVVSSRRCTRKATSLPAAVLGDVCKVTHTYSKNTNQPGKVANPARGRLNRENEYFPVPVRA